MHSYVVIQNTYAIFEMALFINDTLLDRVHEDKRHASKLFIPLLNQLLTQNNSTLSALSFCAVNCGPGPFSTLRSIIASANGLHCATKIPLISIDGLYATFSEFYDNTYQHTIVLLNAFNNEVYYLRADKKHVVTQGYKKIEQLLADTQDALPNEQLYFIGNGTTLYQDLITSFFGNNAIIPNNNPQFCSVEYIGKMGLEAFINNKIAPDYLMPLHLKKHPVEL